MVPSVSIILGAGVEGPLPRRAVLPCVQGRPILCIVLTIAIVTGAATLRRAIVSVTIAAISLLGEAFCCLLQDRPIHLKPGRQLNGGRRRRRIRSIVSRILVLAIGKAANDHARIKPEHRVIFESFPRGVVPNRPPKLLLVALVKELGFDAGCIVCWRDGGVIGILSSKRNADRVCRLGLDLWECQL
jgi:hypothetical protein